MKSYKEKAMGVRGELWGVGHRRDGGQRRLPEGVTFELKEASKPPLWLLRPPDSMGKKSDPKSAAGPLRVLKLTRFHCQFQVRGGRGVPQLRRADCSWPWLPGPPWFPGECTQQEGRG